MRREKTVFRLTAAAAITGLSASFLPPSAWAQPASPQAAPADQANPPARVGALTQVQGSVSFHAAGADSWSPAAVNFPVTTGDGFWTQPAAEARIDVSDSDLVMASGTELEIGELDTTAMVATLPQGEAFLQVRNLAQGETDTIVTPRGAVTITTPGSYDVLAGDTGSPTLITVLEGNATLSQGADGTLAAGQAAEITGDAAPFQVQIVPAAHDAFIDHVLAEQRPPPPQRAAVPALVAQMPGGQELQEYGTWTPSPQYGDVWYPQVAPGWVPYRDGYWSYVVPWGWTWVDSDPWGFAPFHYGRWIRYGGRWGWIPGGVVAGAPAYPVYAPALVTFFGIGVAVGVTAALLSSGSVGWVPLGPGEVYRPWFRAGPGYLRDVNIRNVTNISQINSVTNNITVNRFRNSAGATVVPASAMAASRPIRAVARPANAQMLAQARPVIGREPITPTTATVGVTPAIAREVHAGPPPAGVAAPRPAPGPVIRARAAQVPGAPGAARRVEVPPLTRPTGPARAGAPAQNAPAQNAARPEVNAGPEHRGPAVPALRTPGAAPPAHPLEERGASPSEAPRGPGAAIEPRGAETARPAEHQGAANRGAEAPRAATPARPEAAQPAPRAEPGRPARGPVEARPAPARPTTPEVRPAARPVAPAAPVVREPARPATPEVRPAPRPAAPVVREPARPAAPAFHPAPAPRPAPAARPAPAPRPAPARRPAPEARPAPAPRPAARPAPREEKRPQ